MLLSSPPILPSWLKSKMPDWILERFCELWRARHCPILIRSLIWPGGSWRWLPHEVSFALTTQSFFFLFFWIYNVLWLQLTTQRASNWAHRRLHPHSWTSQTQSNSQSHRHANIMYPLLSWITPVRTPRWHLGFGVVTTREAISKVWQRKASKYKKNYASQ